MTRRPKTASTTKRRARREPTAKASPYGLTGGLASAPVLGLLGAPTTTPKSPTVAQGSDGVAAWGGYLFTGETQPALISPQLWVTYSNILAQTVIVAAAVRYFLNLVAGAGWSVEPNPLGGADAERAVEIVQQGIFDADMPMPWQTAVRKAALFRFYGFSIHAWKWRKRSDGMIVLADLAHRPQYTVNQWDIPVEGQPFAGVIQLTRQGVRYRVDRNRMWYCVDNTLTDSPDGIGLLRHVVEHSRRLALAEMFEGFALETDLRGVPIGRAPLSKLKEYARANVKGGQAAEDAWVNSTVQQLSQFLQNHVKTPSQGMLLDSAVYTTADAAKTPSVVPQWAIQMIQGDSKGLPEVANVIARLNGEIARALGVEFMMMGEGSSGSRAMHEDKTAQFGAQIQATLSDVANFARNDLARMLVAANGLDPDTCTPFLRPDPVSTASIRDATGALLDLAQAGAPLHPNDLVINQLRKRGQMVAAPEITLMDPLAGDLRRAPGDPSTDPEADPTDGTPPPEPTADDSKPGAKPAADVKKPVPKDETTQKRQPKFSVGDRIECLVNHMPGMKGMTGKVSIARAGAPPYYGVRFDEQKKMPGVHKWLAEDEVKAADATNEMEM